MSVSMDDFQVVQAVGLFFGTFILEDVALLSGASLAASGVLNLPLAFGACYLGVWVGDLGLFALAHYFGRPILDLKWIKRHVTEEKLARSRDLMQKHSLAALVLSRIVPGSRLPTYLTAGMVAMPAYLFAAVTCLTGLVWVSIIFFLVIKLGKPAAVWMLDHLYLLTVGLLLAATVWFILHFFVRGKFSVFSRPRWQRWRQWEFWPGWLFYPPVGLIYLYLAIKYGGLELPMASNPGMRTGGLIGESKYEILHRLHQKSPGFVSQSFLIDLIEPGNRVTEFHRLMSAHRFTLPVVLKPNVAQRGNGFKLVRSMAEAENYLRSVTGDIILQEYAPGPGEAGIFYYRFPHEASGHIFAITHKIFPSVTGDGQRTLEQLIRSDPRAAIIAETYLDRHGSRRTEILAAGQTLQLVEAGNHSQGCIFGEGMHLHTPELERSLDRISQSLDGFYIGRYDVRYSRERDLMRGENFKIIELNGASSEATSLYDHRNSLGQAYATLFEQWELVFAIGAANRKLGHVPDTLGTLWQEWRKYRENSRSFPRAD